MKQTIWKYPVSILREQTIVAPAGARFLSVQEQGGTVWCWAHVRPNMTEELPMRYAFRVYGTGHDIPEGSLDGFRFLGTVQQQGGALVWHVFVRDFH